MERRLAVYEHDRAGLQEKSVYSETTHVECCKYNDLPEKYQYTDGYSYWGERIFGGRATTMD